MPRSYSGDLPLQWNFMLDAALENGLGGNHGR
jgi:hypothetical protein